MQLFASLRELNLVSMMLRIICAMAVGGIIGFDREKKGRPAGFRTYMLVALGAAMTVMLGQYLYLMLNTRWAAAVQDTGVKTDVARFSAQVINGVGFLGAGTILVTGRKEVKGVTTAAALWASACIGIAVGAGFYECVLIGFLLILCSMKLLPRVEEWVMAKAVNMTVYAELDSIENLGSMIGVLKQDGIRLYDVDIEKDQQGIARVNATISMRLPGRMRHTELLARLSTVDGIAAIEEI